jgi:hypothetical protein
MQLYGWKRSRFVADNIKSCHKRRTAPILAKQSGHKTLLAISPYRQRWFQLNSIPSIASSFPGRVSFATKISGRDFLQPVTLSELFRAEMVALSPANYERAKEMAQHSAKDINAVLISLLRFSYQAASQMRNQHRLQQAHCVARLSLQHVRDSRSTFPAQA